MEPKKRRETFAHEPGQPCDDCPSTVLDLDPDDPELEAWLAAREAELADMAWSAMDSIDDRSWQ